MAGGFAALVAAAARRTHGDGQLRVLAAGPGPALGEDLARACGESAEFVEATFSVLVDDESFEARVTVPRALVYAAGEAAWSVDALRRLGDVPLAIPVVAAVFRTNAAEIGSLRRGDALVPGAWALRQGTGGVLTGPVTLAAPSYEQGLRAEIGGERRLVLRGGTEPLGWTAEEDDVNDSDKDALVEAVGEVPVVVRVEIGVAEMRAREWAAVGRGDVIALGRKLGEPVTLRIGGVAVARGELVDLDGEVGVRILGRTEER
jgi:type III secretion system YscQ/HrcQ family protein